MSTIMPAMVTTATQADRAHPPMPPLLSVSRCLAALWLLGGLLGCASRRASHTPIATGSPATPILGVIEVLTSPEGASISLNGDSQGTSPQRLTVSPGTYTVRIAAEGYEPITVEVTAEASRKVTVSETLRDMAAPRVTLAALPERVRADEGLKVSAQADDNDRVVRMVLRVDGAVLHEVEERTLRFNVDTRTLAAGRHDVIVEAWDAAGNAGEARAVVAVEAATAVASPEAAMPTATAVASAGTPSPEATAVAASRPTALPTAALQPVVATWGEMTIDTYAYEEALYTDEAAGHPYPLLHRDRVGAPRPRTYRVLRLRNAYLELTFLPELGGRIYQVRYLPTGQDLLYNNRAIKPTHWGPEDQGWWLAVGGIEFCLPVNEHGYVTAEPWDTVVSQGADGSATATMAIEERSRGVQARVEVTLRPGEAGFTVRTTLHNPHGEARALQYWTNAMLSPGAHGVQASLRFYYPTDTVIVHSRGDGSLPDAHGTMAWPVHAGIDMSHYANWRDYLGFFAPNLLAPYTAVYDEATELGMVRVFPPEIVRGNKLFAFGLGFGDSRAYTDDGSQYVEMWSGLSPTFWDDVTLGPGASVTWGETWYAIAGTGGPPIAGAEGTLTAAREGAAVRVTIGAIGERRWTVRVLQGERSVATREVVVRPDVPYRELVSLDDAAEARPVTVRVEDARGRIVMAYEI